MIKDCQAESIILGLTYRPWQKRTHCCGHVVADTNVSPFARARNICCGRKFCVRDTKNVSDFVQKHFVSTTNVSQFAQPKKHHGQQCIRNNVSSFTRALYIEWRETGNREFKKLLRRRRRQRRLKNEFIFYLRTSGYS